MRLFRFKQFQIQQNNEVFRIGTDAVLLGALCNCNHAVKALEIGSGTGIVSLMVAQRNSNINVLAIDIQPKAVALTALNFTNSPFKQRLSAVCKDINQFQSTQKFDFIFSNPPYFKALSSKDFIARNQVYLNYKQLVQNAARFLAKEGVFSVILPSESVAEFLRITRECHLFLGRKIDIYGVKGGKLKRNILEFYFSEQSYQEENFVIEESPRVFSEQYKSVTRNFHPMI